jgi:hypothetical protein
VVTAIFLSHHPGLMLISLLRALTIFRSGLWMGVLCAPAKHYML